MILLKLKRFLVYFHVTICQLFNTENIFNFNHTVINISVFIFY